MTASWDSVLTRYADFLSKPCIVRGKAKDQARSNPGRVVRQVQEFLERYPFVSAWSPSSIPNDYFLALQSAGCTWPPRSNSPAWHWRRAALLSNAGYKCEYCGRSALPTRSRKHALRMEVEHKEAKSKKSKKSKKSNPETWKNLTVACRSCNLIKGQAERVPFVEELMDLAAAVMRKSKLAARSGGMLAE